MQMNHESFRHSTALRVSLKRGLARQALATAARSAADLPALFAAASRMRPNARGVERLALRLQGCPGVTRVVCNARSLTFTAREVCEVESRVSGQTAFRETGLVYLRVRVGMAGGRLTFGLAAVSFCAHALERLVERSDLDLRAPLLAQMDAEAQALFRARDAGACILEGDDEFLAAATPGVWAGGHDGMAPGADWGLAFGPGASVPLFSARTFLSEARMRPTIWLRWKNDPACRIS